jgi:hypothetical protein
MSDDVGTVGQPDGEDVDVRSARRVWDRAVSVVDVAVSECLWCNGRRRDGDANVV